ncbi:ABC transporter substrate-binding protein [Zavarzinia sp. CC-PAN008]|uniref:ABC transporter substrate-binding protein n=1 Tax=Zavarzinia sp. CC-PAN008 TaxID=3243332 RepID=UPI003F74775B
MNVIRFVTRRLFIVLCLMAAAPAMAADTPTAQAITGFHGALTVAMQQSEKLKFEGRTAVIQAAVERTFDIPAITRRVVGSAWRQMSDEDKAKVGQAFTRLAAATLASQFKSYSGDTFETGEAVPQADNRVLQRSRLVFVDGSTPVNFDYVMHEAGGSWRVVDIFLDGRVSEVERRREEFISILRAGGVPALLDAIDRKVASLSRT